MPRRCSNCAAEIGVSNSVEYVARGKRGVRGTCRACWNAQWRPVIAAHQRRYYRTNHNGHREKKQARARAAHAAAPEGTVARVRLYAERHPERDAARRAVQAAVRSGRLVRLPCVVCGATRVDGHHDDYARPLDVIWLCRAHHGERHQMLNNHKQQGGLTPKAGGRLVDGREWSEFPTAKVAA